jgi:hypothetical protein
MLESFAQRIFDGVSNGHEFFTHDGQPCGYEGTLTHGFYALLAIARHKGIIEPLNPEWWPA